jgi:septal ring factor EnvC (AmiA/AmiB activator)
MEKVKFKSWFQKMGSRMRAMKREIDRTEKLLENLDIQICFLRDELRDKVKIHKESCQALGALKVEQKKEERVLQHKLRGYIEDNVEDAQALLTEFEKADF